MMCLYCVPRHRSASPSDLHGLVECIVIIDSRSSRYASPMRADASFVQPPPVKVSGIPDQVSAT